jgi:hypothetical protein
MSFCKKIGLDILGWMREGLLDYVVITGMHGRYFSFDIPVDRWIETAGGACRIVASPDSYKATASMYRGAFANYFAMGQKDSYLFNFFTARAEQREYYPFRDEDYALLRDLRGLVTLWGRPKHFVAAGSFHPPANDPIPPRVDGEVGVEIFVGEDLAACREAMILRCALLRVTVKDSREGDVFRISLNGRPLPPDHARKEDGQIVFDLAESSMPLLRSGRNQVTIRMTEYSGDSRPVLASVELLTDYDLTGVRPSE